MKTKIVICSVFILSAMAIFTSCKQTDVIGNASVSSFTKVLNVMDDNIISDDQYWILEAPDSTAQFFWSKDFNKTEEDLKLIVDAKPFIDAGLDPSKLPEELVFEHNKIIVTDSLGGVTGKEYDTPGGAYEQIRDNYRNRINYHSDIDLMGIRIGNGNMFDWAKDMKKNDKDIVFVLNPQPFIEAGVEVENIKGWSLGQVKAMNSKGKPINTDKLLKPFNLK